MNVDTRLSTGYHPQTDGQTERVNQSLNQYLRIYTSYLQDNWVSLLPLAEFSYNNSEHSSTGFTPFYANAAYNPRGVIGDATGVSDKPNELATYMSEISEFLQGNLKLAAERMKHFADRDRAPAPKYSAGDKVLLSTKNVTSMRPKAKWDDKWIGPFKVIKEAYPDSDAYVLELPPYVKIHPVFHTSLLIPYKDSTIPGRVQPPPPQVEVDGFMEDEVEKILECKVRHGKVMYRIRWKGYGPADDTWEEHLPHAQELVDEFHAKYPRPVAPAKKAKKPQKKKSKSS